MCVPSLEPKPIYNRKRTPRLGRRTFWFCRSFLFDNNNNNYYYYYYYYYYYLLQLGCHPVAVVILHVYKIRNWLLLNLPSSQNPYDPGKRLSGLVQCCCRVR